jgi:hypothetical protein
MFHGSKPFENGIVQTIAGNRFIMKWNSTEFQAADIGTK